MYDGQPGLPTAALFVGDGCIPTNMLETFDAARFLLSVSVSPSATSSSSRGVYWGSGGSLFGMIFAGLRDCPLIVVFLCNKVEVPECFYISLTTRKLSNVATLREASR
jgi:hypothetical protein